ncbi:sulfurtransferase [Geomonas limicola]|uniref:sulfurtransferase n=1 Tax=Geomonas limicola TaxID=2740186 RepID=UPI0016151851|nr:rhodanese-like domain-containing protein [Geomonas limicola]
MSITVLAGCGSTVTDKTGQSQEARLVAASAEFPNAGLLVTGESLQQSLGTNLVIIDARSAAAYAAGHIPGAINLQHSAFWTKGSGLKDSSVVAGLLGAAGISRDRKIVVYDDTTASWGSAGRVFWMLEYLGCQDAHILNGGWNRWSAENRSVQTTAVTLPAATFTPQVNAAAKSDSAHIATRLFDRDFAVIDTRTDEEYLGWQLYGETRGGHIPKAVNIPYGWFYNSDKTTLGYSALKSLLESRGITPDKEVTAHCTAGIRSGYAYFLLRLMGYTRCSNYDASIWDWADNTSYPMEKAPNYATAVYPGWVKALIDYHKPGSTSAAPPQYGYDRNHKYLIFETQWGSFNDMAQGWADNAYLVGHIPGAIHSNSDVYENGFPRWFLLPDSDLKAAVGSMGITPDTTVVVYSDSSIFAARLWWILKYAGVTDVRFMNGDMTQWKAAGYPVETTVNLPVATSYTGSTDPSFIATTPYAEANYAATGTTQLVDVRSGGEYAGIMSGYGYLVNKGRIPNALWAYNADDSSLIYRDADGTLRSYEEVKSLWSSLGIASTVDPTKLDKEAIFYCGGGYRSSLAFFYAYLMGYSNIRNYSDGWSGWSTTYIEDPSYLKDPLIPGSTDGWRQVPSGRPFLTGGL